MILRTDRGLRREITIVLAFKVFALAALWWLFFHGREVAFDGRRAFDRLQEAGSATAPAAAPATSTATGAHADAR